MSEASAAGAKPLSAPHVLEYAYRRSLGPVLGRFFTGLRDRRIEGVKTRSGRVLVPPCEYDPETGEPTSEDFVPVGPGGVVKSWAWVQAPRARHPLSRPFAMALIQLDGADTALLHAVDAGSEEAMATGMRVRVQWAEATSGCIADIACFVPESAAKESPAAKSEAGEPVKSIVTPVRVHYTYTPGVAATKYLHGLAEGKLIGQACDACGRVYVPPRGACPRCGVPTSKGVELSDKGTVVTLTIVRVPSENIQVPLPYCVANILLDGADISFAGLIQECPLEEVRVGMRVQAVWREPSEWGLTSENIRYFKPTGEPDVPFSKIREIS